MGFIYKIFYMVLFSKRNSGDDTPNNERSNQSKGSNFKAANENVPADVQEEQAIPKDSFLPEEISELTDSDNLQFIGPGVIGQVQSEFFGTPERAFRTGKSILQAAKGDVDGAARTLGKEKELAMAKEIKNKVVDGIKTVSNATTPPRMGDTPTGGSRPPGGMGSSFSSAYLNNIMLNIEASPTEIRFDTGVKTNCFSPSDQFPEANYYSPLFINKVWLRIPDDTNGDNTVYSWIRTIYDKLRYGISQNVTYQPASNLLTDSNFNAAFNAIIRALSIYYCIMRILTFQNNGIYQNSGIVALRSTLSPTVVDSFLILRRKLTDFPIPPEFNTLVYWFYQFYSSSELPGSPMIAFSGHSFNGAGGLPSWPEINTVLTDLDNYRDTYFLFAKAFPIWRKTELLTGNGSALHDPNFCTVWINSPASETGGAVSSILRVPSAAGREGGIRYNAVGNYLDGGAYALTSIYDTTASRWSPSMCIPVTSNLVVSGTTYTTNRIAFIDDGSTSAFRPVLAYDLCFAADYTYTNSIRYGNASNFAVPFGFERVHGVSIQTVVESTKGLIDWLFNLNLIQLAENARITSGASLNDSRYYNTNETSSSRPSPKKSRPKKSNNKKKKGG